MTLLASFDVLDIDSERRAAAVCAGELKARYERAQAAATAGALSEGTVDFAVVKLYAELQVGYVRWRT